MANLGSGRAIKRDDRTPDTRRSAASSKDGLSADPAGLGHYRAVGSGCGYFPEPSHTHCLAILSNLFAGTGRDADEVIASLSATYGDPVRALFASRYERRQLIVSSGVNDRIDAIQAAFRLATRYRLYDRPRLDRRSLLYDFLKARLRFQNFEQVIAIFVDSGSRLIADQVVSEGSHEEVALHLSPLFRRAIELEAAGFFVAHNHPSGIATPSEADLRITRELHEAGKILGVRLLDHIIIARDDTFSAREHGLI